MGDVIKVLFLAAVVVAVLASVFASALAARRSAFDTPPPATTSDEVACDLFWPAWGDYAQGLMTEEELREAVKAVHEHVRWAADRNLRLNATDMLTALTIGDLDRYAVAARGTGAACMALGYD